MPVSRATQTDIRVQSGMKKSSPVLLVHGGAGEIPEDGHQARVAGCERAAEAGWAILSDGGSALDAVEVAVRLMEDNPIFNAGHGSSLNARGEVELDAIIMDGQNLNLGAVAAVQRIRNPVSLARLVLCESEHAFLVGSGAEAFARDHGVPICSLQQLLVEEELKRSQELKAGRAPCPPQHFTCLGTVGAVAMDRQGNLVAATSTGGARNKLPGRVGDSPLVGCGAYADNQAAASATGQGEALMKVVICKTACDLVMGGHTPREAAEVAVAVLAERTGGGRGGLVVIDRRGQFGIAHNTSHIAYAVATADGQVDAGIRYPNGGQGDSK